LLKVIYMEASRMTLRRERRVGWADSGVRRSDGLGGVVRITGVLRIDLFVSGHGRIGRHAAEYLLVLIIIRPSLRVPQG
jgi:hypothetical protein